MSDARDSLVELTNTGARRLAKSIQAAGASELTKVIRSHAPVGKTKATRKAVGRRRFIDSKAGFLSTKTGINVGHRPAAEVTPHEPHAHLVGMGTKPRFRRRLGGKFRLISRPTSRQLSTGTMPANDFVSRAVQIARPGILARMAAAGKKALEREALRAARRNRSN